MLRAIAALLLAAAPAARAQVTDTLIPVQPGTRLQLENYGGETVIRTWERNAMRIVADHGERGRLDVRNLGSLISVKSQSRSGGPRPVDYQITVPVRTDITVEGVYQDVSVDGVRGNISVNTVNGDVAVRGGEGFISLKSVEGDVVVDGGRGRISVESVNEDVVVRASEGDIMATTVNGDVALSGVTSASVDASTVNGDITYDGTIQDTGRYAFNTHNGDITVAVGENANATVAVSTFSGEFESSFPVRLTETRRNRFTFVLGSGSARLTLESFQGTIELARPGDFRTRRGGARLNDRGKVKLKDKG